MHVTPQPPAPGHTRPQSEGPRLVADTDKRRSAAADIAQFRAETAAVSPAPASLPPSSASHTRSSSMVQDSTRSSSVLHDSTTSQSKSASRRSQSRTSRVSSSRASSRLDTTGSSGVLNSSYEDRDPGRASYYFGEAVTEVRDNGHVNGNCDTGVVAAVPHTGEVVRIRVPFGDTGEADSNGGGQCLSEENIQRLGGPGSWLSTWL